MTSQTYDADTDYIFYRSNGSNLFVESSVPRKTSIFSGTGKYKGISGSGTMSWKRTVENVIFHVSLDGGIYTKHHLK